ncbi:hypothetical protein [Hydrogenophaga sp.]|uniref:hypothetical protein n=1 Tax=Hydrogenophaga sp. TaxID=1904254 RepID=UPI0025BBBF8D|nr:hypothetical protein [Hydrogenophaga sp.]MBT9467200.1 hypothetical protein [Hydrogenophaga sp.]
MDFRTFFRHLTPDQREAFAQKVQTTVGYCHQLAYGEKRLELGLADAIVAVAPAFGCVITLAELELTDRAKAHNEIRRGSGVVDEVHGSGVSTSTPETT